MISMQAAVQIPAAPCFVSERGERVRIHDTFAIVQGLVEFAQANSSSIERAKGHIFFKDAAKSRRIEPYLEPNYVRNRFRHYLELAGLDEVYDTSDE